MAMPVCAAEDFLTIVKQTFPGKMMKRVSVTVVSIAAARQSSIPHVCLVFLGVLQVEKKKLTIELQTPHP